MTLHRPRQAVEMVAPFEHGNDPPLGMGVGKLEKPLSQRGEILILKREVPQGIALATVESR